MIIMTMDHNYVHVHVCAILISYKLNILYDSTVYNGVVHNIHIQ